MGATEELDHSLERAMNRGAWRALRGLHNRFQTINTSDIIAEPVSHLVLEILSGGQDIGLLIARIFFGALFIVHGAPKLFGPARPQMRGGMAQMGIPPGLFDLIGILEFFGGLAIIGGFLTRLTSVLFALEMVGTTLLYVTKLSKAPMPRGMLEEGFKRTRGYLTGWELDTVLLGLAIVFATFGPGSVSIDAVLPLGL